jgi:hypothetical protein
LFEHPELFLADDGAAFLEFDHEKEVRSAGLRLY